MTPPSIEIRGLTLADSAGRAVLVRLSLTVGEGERYALVGRGGGPRELLRCVSGDRRPDEGTVSVGGLAPRKARRRLGRGLLLIDDANAVSGSVAFDLALAADPSPETAARLAAGSGTVLVATSSSEVAAAAGGRVGILRRDRLLIEGWPEELVTRFRLIRYANRLTESRTAFGTELDEFHAVRVRVRGWGIEAIVADFREDALERLRAVDGVEEVSAETMGFAEIVEAVSGS